MPEDNIPNDNLNQPNIPDGLNDLSSANLAGSGVPNMSIDDVASVNINPAAQNINFDEIAGSAINEVKVET